MILKRLNTSFTYLDHFSYRLLHVAIILVFSVLFLVVFEPFNINLWINYPVGLQKFGLAGFGVIGSAIIALSQLVVRPLLRIKQFKVKHFLWWTSIELLAITAVLTFLFGESYNSYFTEMRYTFKYTALVLVLPYSFSLLLLALIRQRSVQLLESTLTNTPDKPDLVHFKDERDQVKFSVKRTDILYLESTDNYITIYCSMEGLTKKEMIRTSMKKLEDIMRPKGLIRCHRSFMVNLENVQWMKKEGRNYLLKIKSVDTLIPVSRSYATQFKSLIQA